jgi:pectate lyase
MFKGMNEIKHVLIGILLIGTNLLCVFAETYQAEDAFLYNAVQETKNGGFTGESYVNFDNEPGSYLELRVGMEAGGTQNVTIRFANGSSNARPMQMDINGTEVLTSITFDPTGSWTNWDSITVQVPFQSGVNYLRLTSTGAEGGPNIDMFDIEGEQLPTYSVNFSVEGEGSVKVHPENGLLFEGMEITLVARPDIGYEFKEWQGDFNGTRDTLKFLAFEDVHVVAIFNPLEIEIPVPDFSMTGFAAMPGEGLETTTGGMGGDTLVIENLQELIAWGNTREDNDTPEIVLLRGKIEAEISQVVTIKRGGNISILGDTRGTPAYAELRNVSLNIRDYSNLIIRNLKMHEVLYPNDNITIDNCHHVWIDHCELYSKIGDGIGVDTYDGLLDIKNGSHNVTVSWCYFHDHMKTLLMGHSDNNGDLDVNLQATFHHNRFSHTDGRNPSLRFGMIHFYNNYLENISDYGLAIRNGAHAKIENCHFESVNLPVTTDKFTGHGFACVSGSVYTGSCREEDNQITEPTDCEFWETMIPYEYDLENIQTVALSIATYAGVGKLQDADTLMQDTSSTRIIEAEEILTLTSYYNPVERCIWLNLHTESQEQITILLFSANGVLVDSKNLDPVKGDQSIKMDVSTYAPGIYILGLQNRTMRTSKRIIIR